MPDLPDFIPLHWPCNVRGMAKSGVLAHRLRLLRIIAEREKRAQDGPRWTYPAKLSGKKQDGYHHGDDAKRDNSMPPHVRRLAGLTGCRYGKRRLNFQLAVTITNTRS